MLKILAIVAELGVLICFIIVLIKQFQNGGVVHGIIGIITCTLWTFIWGWMNSGKLNIRNIMLIWTVLIIAVCVLVIAGGGFNYSYSIGTPTQ
ncbi:MAG TPA: hypothetical protein VHE60_17755 [Pyrinomonadaceae bacterium]|nr:hypothetical protein [Pyrinomonadaceae bacterium]